MSFLEYEFKSHVLNSQRLLVINCNNVSKQCRYVYKRYQIESKCQKDDDQVSRLKSVLGKCDEFMHQTMLAKYFLKTCGFDVISVVTNVLSLELNDDYTDEKEVSTDEFYLDFISHLLNYTVKITMTRKKTCCN